VIDFAISACADWRITAQLFLGTRSREPSSLLPTNGHEGDRLHRASFDTIHDLRRA
jgi:hypothetical protein